MRHRLWFLAAAALLLDGAACGTDSSAPVQPLPPLTLRVSLTTPHPDDGAMLFEVSGPAIDAMTAVNPLHRLYSHRLGSATVRAIVAGNLTNGPMATFVVPGGNTASAYTVTVSEVVDRQNQVRPQLSGYVLSIAP